MNIPNLQKKYKDEIVTALQKEFDIKNVMEVPRLEKVVINMGLGEAVQDPKLIDMGVYTLTQISGQKPLIAKASKAISNFKLRAGVPIGCYVTLRGTKMYEFLERLIKFALPRVRDFKGLSGKAFDGCGNYSIGLKEQLIFPEIEYDKISKVKGLNITIVTTSRSDIISKGLLRMLGMPFRN